MTNSAGRSGHILLSFLSLLLFLAIGEGILQVHHRLTNGYWLFVGNKNFQVGFTQPVHDERVYALRPGFKNLGITIDSAGIRGNNLTAKKSKRVIADMGDSVPFGIKVRDAETYPYFLDSIIMAENMDWAAINGGTPGYNMRQAYYNLKNNVYPRFHPEIVTMQAANDLFLLSYYREKWTPNVTWAKVKMSHTWGETTKFALVHYVRNAFSEKPEPENYIKYNGKAMLDHIDASLLPEIIRFCRDNGIKVIFMPVDPFYYSDRNSPKNPKLDLWNENINDVDIWDETVKSYNDILAGHADKNENVYFFDSRTYLDDYDRNGLYLDYIHYSAEGNRIVAQGLFNFIVENNLLNVL